MADPPPPAGERPVNDSPVLVEAHEEEKPTASHELATTEQEEKGLAQLDHGDIEVKDLGWNDHPEDIPQPLVGRLPNDELWTLMRRFDKQIFHVKAIPQPPLAELDLNIADDEEFNPDKLRAQLERLYMTVIIGTFGFWKHIVRLRSWRESRRTSAFLSIYAIAWAVDYLQPTLIAFLMVLILFPKSRSYCFPPAPASLIDSKTGGIQTPAAGVLASKDSVTGAPEKHQGEAVEQEARNFVSSLSTVVVSTAAGKNPHADPHSEGPPSPDPSKVIDHVANAKNQTGGDDTSPEHDRTKEPVAEAAWKKARPVMHMVADFTDTYERFGNALSATPPFPRREPRMKLAACLLPVLLGTMFTSSYMLVKGTGFAVGFGFFGDPIIQKGVAFINRKIPDWQKYLELRHTILKGIPTNAQLTLTILRIGEGNRAPLPPPPSSGPPPATEAHPTAAHGTENLEGVSKDEVDDAIHPNEDTPDFAKEKPKKASKVMAFIRGTAKGGVNTALGIDKAKAVVGGRHAKDRLGVVKSEPTPPTGPVHFPARYKGKKGHAYITVAAMSPALSWTTSLEKLDPAWTIAIGDIRELKKVGGLGWKSKLVVGWASGYELADGLIITDVTGQEHHLTSILERDELFNRLVSMGNQMWEAW